MSVVVVGLNHRTVPLRVLEAVAVADADLPKALHDLVGREPLAEVVVVSTCMRTEVYATAARYHAAVGAIRTFLADWSGLPPEAMSDHLYDFYDDAAVRHLLRVAAGLDSAVLGEGEILRQVRSAWEAARLEGSAGAGLGVVFRQAFETGKRVRTDTAIARGTTSLSHTAISLAGSVGVPLSAVPPEAAGCPVIGHGGAAAGAGLPRAVVPAPLVAAPVDLGAPVDPGAPVGPGTPGAPGVGDRRPGASAPERASVGLPASSGEQSGPPCTWASLLAGRTVLVIGAGEMGEAIATLAAGAPGAGPVLVANRTPERAARLAGRVGGRAVAWSELPVALAAADIVFTSTAAPGAVIDAADVAAARQGRPTVIVDIAVPRDVTPDVGRLPGVTLFDISDLKAHAEAAMQSRRNEIPKAEAIVDGDVERYRELAAQRQVAPVVAALHQRAEAIREAEVLRLAGRLGDLDDRQQRAVVALTRGIVAKLLHEPTVAIKAAAAAGRPDPLAAAVEELFGLGPGPVVGDETPPTD